MQPYNSLNSYPQNFKSYFHLILHRHQHGWKIFYLLFRHRNDINNISVSLYYNQQLDKTGKYGKSQAAHNVLILHLKFLIENEIALPVRASTDIRYCKRIHGMWTLIWSTRTGIIDWEKNQQSHMRTCNKEIDAAKWKFSHEWKTFKSIIHKAE